MWFSLSRLGRPKLSEIFGQILLPPSTHSHREQLEWQTPLARNQLFGTGRFRPTCIALVLLLPPLRAASSAVISTGIPRSYAVPSISAATRVRCGPRPPKTSGTRARSLKRSEISLGPTWAGSALRA